MKYVAWAEIAGPPVPSGRSTAGGRPLFVVQYRAPAEPFEQPVPREILDQPVETWLRPFPRGRARNVATFGRAIRPLSAADFERILELAGATTIDTTRYPLPGEHDLVPTVARERSEVLISMLKRSAQFRRDVISAYERRCAVSGFELGSVPLSKAGGLLDAAHISTRRTRWSRYSLKRTAPDPNSPPALRCWALHCSIPGGLAGARRFAKVGAEDGRVPRWSISLGPPGRIKGPAPISHSSPTKCRSSSLSPAKDLPRRHRVPLGFGAC